MGYASCALRILLVAVLTSVSFFSAGQDNRTAQMEAFNAKLIEERDRDGITWLEWRQLVHRMHNSLYPKHPVTEEFHAYTQYVAAEVDAGRVTKEYGNYLIAQKRSEVAGRLEQEQVQQIQPVLAAQCEQARSEVQHWCFGAGRSIPGMAGYKCADAQNRIGSYCRR